ncbi:alpha/beta fold hydrolase [Actinomycetota bacterium]
MSERPSTASPLAHVVRRGSGLAVLGLHGNGVDHRLLLPLDPTLESAGGLERIYLDLAGFGQTPALGGNAGLPELADWLSGQVQQIIADRPFAILANSLGGLLARHLAGLLPDQVVGVALLAPVVHPDASLRRLPDFAVVERDEGLLDSLTAEDRAEFTEMAARQTRAVWEGFREFALPGIRAADPDAMDRLGARYFLADPPDGSGAPFSGPALVVTGRQDHVVGYEDQFDLVRRHYPQATYAALHGAGHNVHLDCPAATAALLGQWAADLPR